MGRGAGRGEGAEIFCLRFGSQKFGAREVVRIANRSKHDVQEELNATLKKLAMWFPVWYGLFYAVTMILCATFSYSPDGKEPFDANACDWTSDRGKVIFISTIVTFTVMLIPAVFIIGEGKSKVYDRVWDFTATTMLVHLILSAAISGGVNRGEWWLSFVLGGLILSIAGYYLSNWHWGRIAQQRLDNKVSTMSAG